MEQTSSYTAETSSTVAPNDSANDFYALPVSFAQMEMWLACQMFGNSAAYHVARGFFLEGPLRHELLEQSLNEIIARHEVLRTSFAVIDGSVQQLVIPEYQFALPVTDFPACAPGEYEAAIYKLAKRHACAPFDLTRGPLVRFELIRMTPQRHALICTMHHLITDGWSQMVFLRELLALYGALARDERPSLPELSIQYGDFARWEHEWLQGERLDRLVDYWKKQLAGVPETLALPADHPRGEQPPRGAFHIFQLDPETTERLTAISRAARVTPYMVLATALAVYLHRLASQDDIVIGSPVANRNQVELENLIGLFLNTLVLRIDVSGNPAFLDLLGRVRETVYGAQEHQGLPLDKLIAALGKNQRQSSLPFVRVLFNLENAPQNTVLEAGGVTFNPFQIGTDASKIDLIWNAQERPSGLLSSFEYNSELFEASTIRHMAEGLCALLRGIAADPKALVDDLPILSGTMLQEIVSCGEASRREQVIELCAHQMFELQARRVPEAPAVIEAGKTLTFAELDRQTNQLARYLVERRVGPESLVAVAMPGCSDFLVAMLGVLKAGAAYMPVDLTMPAERTAFMLKDAGVQLILTHGNWVSLLPDSGIEAVRMDELAAQLARHSTEALSIQLQLDNLAYVIYTSGSTGKPKGVMVTHRGLANYLQWCKSAYPIHEGGGAPLHGALVTDMAVTTLFAPLIGGSPVNLLPESGALEQLAATLRSGQKFGFVKLTPSHLQMLSILLPPEAAAAARCLIVGGEALSFEHLSFWRRNAPQVRIINEYGPTEAVVGCCTFEVKDDDPASGAVCIGRPTTGVRLYVLDSLLQPLPIGVTGELFIGGAQTTRGYLGHPALTAERFVPDPFSTEPGARLYRTGDLTRYRHDHTLEYFGRIDHQVKIRGFRVETGEIEAAFSEHAAVAQAVVVASPDETGQQQLAAYVVPQKAVTANELTVFLSAKLPVYMVPPTIMIMEALPLTPSGKVDRKALPSVSEAAARSNAGREFTAPRNALEDILSAIWSKVLNVERVGIHDNFYSLGGDSIKAISMVALAKSRGLPLSTGQLSQHRTIAELAMRIQLGQTSAEEEIRTAPFSLVSPQDRERLAQDIVDAYPLSRMQLGMLFHNELTPNAPLFHSINSYKLHLPLDGEKFQAAVLHVTARHPNLRTSFDLSSYSEPLQLVHRDPVFPVPVIDLRGVAEEDQRQSLKEFWQAETRRPFDLSLAPQLRFHIHCLAKDAFYFTLTENHAIVDGWSLHLMFDEILKSYLAALGGEPMPAFPPLETTFRDFILAERRILESPEAEAFWESAMQDYQVARLPRLPGHRPDFSKPRGKRVDRLLPGALVRRLRKLAREEAVPLKSVLLAAHLKVMSFVTGRSDIVTGLSSNGRLETTDAERVCGLFLNTLPLRFKLSGGTWREMVRQTAEAELKHLPFRRYPLSAIQAKWGQEPLFDSSFVYLNFHVINDQIRSGGLGPVETGAFVEETNFAIMTSFQHQPGKSSRMVFNFCADRWLLTDRQIDEIEAYYLRVLEEMTSNPSGRADMYSPLADAERSQILAYGTGPDCDLEPASLVQAQFTQHAGERPESPCLHFAGKDFSYREVEERSNQLAHYLRSKGIGPESRVAIGMDRVPEMVIALLGILKAGGCYVPVDPASPQERLGFIIEDSGTAMVLTMEKWRSRFTGTAARHVALDADWDQIAAFPPSNPQVPVSGDQLAYLIYTSGTTGRPKAVALEHRQLANYTAAVTRHLELPRHGRYGLISTFAADLGNTMIFPALCSGSCLHIFSEAESTDPVLLAQSCSSTPIHCLKIVPTHLNALLSHPDAAAVLPQSKLVLGGEACDGRLIEKIVSARPECRIFNHYGPTETTVGVLTGEIKQDGWESSTKPLLGHPLDNIQVYVVDAQMQLVPMGTPGELCVGGAGVARGYWNRPDLTAEKFVPDPFGKQSGGRLYRTGDLVRRLASGSLEFLGRIDQQIKIHGHRIELLEIESVLREHAGVSQAVAIIRQQLDGPQLAAYVTTAGEVALSEEQLRSFAAGRLPRHAVPPLIRVLRTFPLTSNGKIDRKALAHLDNDIQRKSSYTPPDSPLEMEIARIWQEVLNIEQVGLYNSFFDLGGNSIKAILLAARVRKAFGVHVSLETILAAGTVAGLASILENALQRHSADAVPITRAARDGNLPLSFAQQRFWYGYQMDPDTPTENVPLAVRLRGPLDAKALERSLNEIVCRHEILRTAFPTVNGEPRQSILPELSLPVLFKDISDVPSPRQDEVMRDLVREEAWKPFVLDRAPLLRALLVRMNDEDHGFILTAHHIIIDGWSVPILMRELADLYRAFRSGQPSALPEPALQYADFACWQRSRLTPEAEKAQLDHWKTRLAGAPDFTLPEGSARASTSGQQGKPEHLWFSEEMTAALQQLCRQEGTTLFMLLLAGYATVLYSRSKQHDIVIGCPIANHRNRAELENVIGPFLNTLALRIDLSGNPGFRGLLRNVRGILLQAYANQDVPFEKVVDALAIRRDTGRNPVFQVWYAHSDMRSPFPGLDGLQASPLDVAESVFQLDLLLSTELVNNRLTALLQYDSGVIAPTTASTMLQDLEGLLARVVADPDTKIAEITAALDELAQERARKESADREERQKLQMRSIRRNAVPIVEPRP